MKRERLKRSKRRSSPVWSVTYADMIQLILVFFILLFAMSQIDMAKFESITRSFQSRAILDFLPSSVPSEDISSSDNILGGEGDDFDFGDDSSGDEDEAIDFDKIEEQLRQLERKADALARLMQNVESFLESEDLGDVITATRTEEGVILVLQDSILFESGQAEILDSGRPFLDEVGRLLKGIDNTVRVEGHTDSRPINTYRYPSNWELSGARAGVVVRYFIEEHGIDEDRFLIAGYADTRPVAENTTPENMSKNRRVEIVILDDAHNQAKAQNE